MFHNGVHKRVHKGGHKGGPFWGSKKCRNPHKTYFAEFLCFCTFHTSLIFLMFWSSLFFHYLYEGAFLSFYEEERNFSFMLSKHFVSLVPMDLDLQACEKSESHYCLDY